jgi:pyruvate dehydrogenase E1 component alpha subunit
MLELSLTGELQEHTHSGWGMEAVGVGTCTFLRKDDYVIATHRGYAHKIAKGVSLERMLAEFYGKKSGYGKGKDSHHLTAMEVSFIGKWGLIGSQFPIATGLGVAAQAEGKGRVCVIFFGDGSSNRGTFHESLNLSSLWKLPIVWVCENNQYSMSTPVARHTAAENVASYAQSYGFPGITIDGNDVLAVHESVQHAVARARRGDGPSLVELMTHRLRPHLEGIEETRPQEVIDAMKANDPVEQFRRKLMEKGVLTEDADKRMHEESGRKIEDAIKFAEKSPPPEPEVAFEDLFAP